MATTAKRDKVVLGIGASASSGNHVMYVELLAAPTPLAAPPIALEDLTA